MQNLTPDPVTSLELLTLTSWPSASVPVSFMFPVCLNTQKSQNIKLFLITDPPQNHTSHHIVGPNQVCSFCCTSVPGFRSVLCNWATSWTFTTRLRCFFSFLVTKLVVVLQTLDSYLEQSSLSPHAVLVQRWVDPLPSTFTTPCSTFTVAHLRVCLVLLLHLLVCKSCLQTQSLSCVQLKKRCRQIQNSKISYINHI